MLIRGIISLKNHYGEGQGNEDLNRNIIKCENRRRRKGD